MGQKLIEGFKDFRRKAYADDNGLMRRLITAGQDPRYFIISCIDSRANPGTIFNPEPGTFFAHKAMGAIVRPYKTGTALAAALQFALNYNKVDTIIVLGHTGCGAVQALIDGLDDPEISEFIAVAEQSECGTLRASEEKIILQSAENLKSYPSVAAGLAEDRVSILPWLFDMEEGDILEHNPQAGQFLSLTMNRSRKDLQGSAKISEG